MVLDYEGRTGGIQRNRMPMLPQENTKAGRLGLQDMGGLMDALQSVAVMGEPPALAPLYRLRNLLAAHGLDGWDQARIARAMHRLRMAGALILPEGGLTNGEFRVALQNGETGRVWLTGADRTISRSAQGAMMRRHAERQRRGAVH